MNPFDTPSNGPSSDWLMFLVMLGAIGISVCLVAAWVVLRSKDQKKRRKRYRRHHRQHNPTLAQTGGLPPPRDPNQPPPGP
jgi:uncharacterized membrane protein YccC